MKFIQRFCTEQILKNKVSFKERNFVDRMKLYVKAGNGGKGCVCYYRDRIVVSGAPDGGDGGRGGDVYLKACETISDFSIIKKPHLTGNHGKQGMKLKKDGKNGGDMKVSVPVGTIVYELNENDQPQFIVDLDYPDKEQMVAKGGKGGRGNGKNIGIREVLPGEKGVERRLLIELKTIADIGLVGFPNAGKSTLLAAVSRALPKIADYPFTTLNPMVGRVKFIDNFEITIADIPGLIEEAHKNKGLGLEFLRHIERCKMLLYVLNGIEDVEQQLQVLQQEIYHYNKKILDKPYLVCVNKIDLLNNDKYFGISAKHGLNIGKLLLKCKEQLTEIRQQESQERQNRLKQKQEDDVKRQFLEKKFYQ